MTLRTFFAVLLLVALAMVAGSQQQPTEQQKRSDEILTKIRKVQLYNQVLPVLFTQEQVRALLPILEKHRAEAAKLENEEFKWLQSVEPQFTSALTAAEGKGATPDAKMMDEVVLYFNAFVLKRKDLVNETVASLKKTMKEKLNEGQVRAAANAFDPRGLQFTKPVEELTEDEKLDNWVRVVLMDSHTYYILTDLSKKN